MGLTGYGTFMFAAQLTQTKTAVDISPHLSADVTHGIEQACYFLKPVSPSF